MARPRSEQKQKAIMAAAIRVIAAQGLGAPTATIAQEAKISNGSLFTYFETKADLLNRLYIELKLETAAAAMDGLPTESDMHAQVYYMWSRTLHWATSYPEKRRALEQLSVSDEITPASRATGHQIMADMAALLGRSRENGPLRDAQLDFIVALMSALADATGSFMVQDPVNAEAHCKIGFEALWRVLA